MKSIVNEIRNSIGKQITELRTESVRGPKAVAENAAQRMGSIAVEEKSQREEQ